LEFFFIDTDGICQQIKGDAAFVQAGAMKKLLRLRYGTGAGK